MIRRLTLGATLVAAGCGTLPHDADPIPGSRPGLTDDTELALPRSLQAEAGVDVGRIGGVDFTAAELLLRYGLVPSLEVRLAVESSGGRGSGARGQALEDLEVGFKVRLTEGGEGLPDPALTLVPFVGIPTGADRLTSGSVEPGALLAAEWELGGGLEWTGNVGGTGARGDEGRFLELFVGGAVGRELSDRLGVELEVVRIVGVGGHSPPAGLWHGALGAAWLLDRDAQLDAWAGVQREARERGGFVGVGISVRR